LADPGCLRGTGPGEIVGIADLSQLI